jgi:hypothetical protein
MVKKFSLIVSLLLVSFINCFYNFAQASISTIAKVNDEMITSYDFKERVKLFSVLNGLPESSATEMKKEILDTLINDKLYLIAAKASKVKYSEKEVSKKANKIIAEHPELKNHTKALKSYIAANIAWISTIQQKFMAKINVTPSEIASEKKNHKKDAKYYFKQAVIPIDLFKGDVKEQILSITNCMQLDPLLQKFNLDPAASLTLASHEIREEAKSLFNVASLNKAQATLVENAVQVISICKIITTNFLDDEAKERIFESKLHTLSEQYLKTLREDAIIEIYNN